jgi:hypothetical protein
LVARRNGREIEETDRTWVRLSATVQKRAGLGAVAKRRAVVGRTNDRHDCIGSAGKQPVGRRKSRERDTMWDPPVLCTRKKEKET